MRLIYLTLFASCAFLNPSYAQQNLIPNPDFEEYYGCGYEIQFDLLQDILPGWSARVATADYVNEDCDNLFHPPYNGKGYITANTILTDIPDDSGGQRREYPQVALIDSIYENRNYYLEYYVRQKNEFDAAVSHLGVYFSNEIVLDAVNPQTFDMYPILVEPQLEIDTVVHARGFWKKLSFCYTPDQNYSAAVFGVFRPIEEVVTDYAVWRNYSYDAFYLVEVPDTLSLVITPERDTICAGECLTLSSSHSRVPGSFSWDLPGSNLGSSTDSVVTVCYDTPGVYPIGLSAEHCHGTYSRNWPEAIVVLPNPTINTATQNFQILSGDELPLEICDNSLDWTIDWSPHPGLSCLDCPSPVFTGTSSAELIATISIDGFCPDTCSYNIEVLDLAVADFKVARPTICQGECFRLTNDSRNFSGSIQFGTPGNLETLPSDTENFEFCPNDPGSYELIFIVNGNLNADTLTLTDLVVESFPTPLIAPQNYSANVGELLTLPAGFNARQYHWQVLSGELDLNCTTCSTIRVDPLLSGSIQLTASNGACSDSLLYNIEVARQDAQFYLPTAFSPNFDGVNDEFRAYGNFFTITELEIYDRYGGLMYQESGPTASWDGRAGGRKVVAGVYVYILRYTNIYGEDLMKSGAVTLVP
ncbi:hypothetical protein CEQ90_00415 [Lewinellaceae bacterium SD302]|nr:hypothetical protein CEQ90_00415 [Lewinellaceae bacterium SD302]